jgi:hypothetical protein
MDLNYRDLYRSFAADTPDLPLFMQPWYLDVVCEGGHWDAVLIQKGERTIAALPFFLKHFFNFRISLLSISFRMREVLESRSLPKRREKGFCVSMGEKRCPVQTPTNF